MTNATYFARPCPTCGRMLEIRIELLGREVSCQHCSAHFVATAWTDNREKEKRIDRLLARADQYLLHTHWQGSFCDNPLD